MDFFRIWGIVSPPRSLARRSVSLALPLRGATPAPRQPPTPATAEQAGRESAAGEGGHGCAQLRRGVKDGREGLRCAPALRLLPGGQPERQRVLERRAAVERVVDTDDDGAAARG